MTRVLLAMIPTGRPPTRPSAVTISGAKRCRRNVTVPVSQRVSMMGSTTYARRARSGTMVRSAVWSAACASGTGPRK